MKIQLNCSILNIHQEVLQDQKGYLNLFYIQQHSNFQPCGLVREVEYFGIHTKDLGVDLWGWLPNLHASLNISSMSGAVISVNRFTPSTLWEMWGSSRGFPTGFSLGKKTRHNFNRLKCTLAFFENPNNQLFFLDRCNYIVARLWLAKSCLLTGVHQYWFIEALTQLSSLQYFI